MIMDKEAAIATLERKAVEHERLAAVYREVAAELKTEIDAAHQKNKITVA